ncbi:serine hydrolase [Dyadobacter sp. 50-39]|uniref:serine hydrolase domain-containing protein n=1 Tax=Dyadobacter sp. 50-39 TaxID=1895756 RepID=UPI0025C23A5E|nr:serine hydrolase domain-containing protein [Dyadobacter sp. 50-39]
MTNIFRFLTACALLFCSCRTDEVSPETPPVYNFDEVDKFVEAHLADYNDQVIVLVSQNGKLIYKKGIGLDEHTSKPIASATKWLSAAVILSLVDEGKLTLSDSIGKYLPIFTAHRKGGITIRQLFAHTAGFGGDSPQKYEYKRLMTLAQAVDSIAVYTPLVASPGTQFDYGSAGMQIGGRVAEIVSGKSWQELFDERIAKPCGMTAEYRSVRNPIIAGGVHTTAADYLRFLEMLVNRGTYNGNRVLSESAIGTMLSDQTEDAKITGTPYVTNPFSTTPQRPVRYGVGNWLDVVDADGRVLESSSPGLFGTHPWQDSKHQIAGIIFTQTTPRQSSMTSLEIRKMIRDIVE